MQFRRDPLKRRQRPVEYEKKSPEINSLGRNLVLAEPSISRRA